MDQPLLVTGSIEDGRKLIDRLAAAGFEVTAAGWAKTYHDARYNLHIITPAECDGRRDALRRVAHELVTAADDIGLDPFDVMFGGPGEPLAEGLRVHPRRFAGRPGLWFPEDRLPPVGFDGPAYVYAPVPAPQPAGS